MMVKAIHKIEMSKQKLELEDDSLYIVSIISSEAGARLVIPHLPGEGC